MTISTAPLNRSYLHEDELPEMLRRTEGYEEEVYDDKAPGHYATIGIGLNITTPANMALMLNHLGVFAASDQTIAAEVAAGTRSAETQQQTAARYVQIVADFQTIVASNPLSRTTQPAGESPSEEALQAALDAELQVYGITTGFIFASALDAKDVKIQYITGYQIGAFPSTALPAGYNPKVFHNTGAQTELDSILTGIGVSVPHDTREYKALMSLYFNQPGLIGSGLRAALSDGNRMEAWIQIRYLSNADTSAGIAKRRYWEAEVFGLYEGAVEADEAKGVYRGFTLRRDQILLYENTYSTQINRANIDYALNGDDKVRELRETLDLARDAIIVEYNTAHLGDALVADDYLSTDVFVDAGRSSISQAFDSNRSWTIDVSASTGGRNAIVISEGGDDTITSGAGDDLILGGEGDDTLSGGAGNDHIYGGADNDIIDGGIGNDVLDAGEGTNELSGGEGDDALSALNGEADTLRGGINVDTYYVDANDTVIDEDGLGVIYVGPNHIRLTGGSREQNSGLFVSADGQISYEELGNGVVTAHVDGQTIHITGPGSSGGGWSNGGPINSGLPGLGIPLTTKDDDDDDDDNDDDTQPWAAPFNGAEDLICPLMIDLDGNGIQTISREQGVYFDHNQSGYAERTGWIAGNDGFLVWDKNHNGVIENGNELFGEFTHLSTGQWANNGYRVLRDMDENHDGVVDASDSQWTDVKVWVDQNHNGISELGEVHALSEYSIASIGTTYTYDPNAVDANGNRPEMVGQYTLANGQTRATVDYMLRVDHQDTVATQWIDVSGTAIEAMPDLKGYGDAGTLQQAMARDSSGTLQALVQAFATETSAAARLGIMNQIILRWTGSDTIDPNSRNTNGEIDARMLGALERFMGKKFWVFRKSCG